MPIFVTENSAFFFLRPFMKQILTIILWCFALTVSAQTRGVVTVVKDPKIDSLISRRLEVNKKDLNVTIRPDAPVVSKMGYRVQIYYGSDRRALYREQSRFTSVYDYPTYISYKEPNYYLRTGDFRTRLEAQKFMNTLKSVYPTLFIFREKINPPPLTSNDND